MLKLFKVLGVASSPNKNIGHTTSIYSCKLYNFCVYCILKIEELEKQTVRENHLVAKGGVELLSLDREDYFFLTKLDEGICYM